MPYWAGMLTEEQHSHDELQQAIRQASRDLFFSGTPVCSPPDFVKDQGMDLNAVLEGRPLLVLSREDRAGSAQVPRRSGKVSILPITLEPANSEDFLAALATHQGGTNRSIVPGRKQRDTLLESHIYETVIKGHSQPEKQAGISSRGLAEKWHFHIACKH